MTYNEIKLVRVTDEPIIRPNPHIFAISKNAFNCGVIYDRKKFRMLIRGSYTENTTHSDLVYAESDDGVEGWMIDPEPVLEHGVGDWRFQTLNGIEDPRIVPWQGWYYVFATACSPLFARVGYESGGRVGIWRTKDLADRSRYEWVGIPYDEEDKDASIIPKTIQGKVYLIDRFAPHMWIGSTKDYSLKSGWNINDHKILMRKEQAYVNPFSDISRIGLAGPPLETPKSWFAPLHIVHWDGQSRTYSLSFMTLNKKNPRKVEYVHPEPILWPETEWEIRGVASNIVFSCATVEVDDEIWVYYGGADTVIGLATMKKESLSGICY